MTIYDQVKEIAEQHIQDLGCVVVSLADWQALWDSMPDEEKERNRVGIAIADAPVIHRDEHEGPPRWAPEHESKSWLKVAGWVAR